MFIIVAVSKKLARERIDQLFLQAEEEPNYADRYVELARKIAMKAQLSMPANYRKRYCHKCYSYIISGKTGRIRTYSGKLIVSCFNCGNKDRYPLK